MATDSSVLAWEISWTEEPGGGGKELDTTERLNSNYMTPKLTQPPQVWLP